MMAASGMFGVFAGLIGICVGIIVSSLAIEEVQGFRKVFKQVQALLFFMAVCIVTVGAGVWIMIIALVVSALVLYSLAEQDVGKIICLFMVLFFVLMASTAALPLVTGLFFLLGVLDAGRWAVREERLLTTYALRKQTWKAAFFAHALYVFLPLAGLVAFW